MARKARIEDLYRYTRKNAARRGIDFDLSLADVRELIRKANGRCAVTGVEFREDDWGTRSRPFRPSIDRKDSHGAYTKENCRIVCIAANFAMGEWGEKVLQEMARSMMDDAYDVDTYATEGTE